MNVDMLQVSSAEMSLAAGGTEAAKAAKLASGAHEFEAMLVNELLKPLKFGQAEAAEDGADETGGGVSDSIRGFASEALSKAIAAKGGFGLAKQIIRQVTAEHDRRAGAGSSAGTQARGQPVNSQERIGY